MGAKYSVEGVDHYGFDAPNSELFSPEESDSFDEREDRDENLSGLMQQFFDKSAIEPKSTFSDLATRHECSWTQEQFILLDKEESLPAKQLQVFEKHLKQCSPCAEELTEYKEFQPLISLPEIEPTRTIQSFWKKVTCTEFEDDFVAYLKEEVSKERHQEVSSHLQECAKCSETILEVESNLGLVSQVFEMEIEASPRVWQALKKEMDTTTPSPVAANVPNWRFVVSTLSLAAAILLVAALFVYKLQNPSPTTISGNFYAQNKEVSPEYNVPLATKKHIASLGIQNEVKVLINKNTLFQLKSPHAIYLEKGEMYIEVMKKGYSLTVETPNANAMVLGTKFNIEAGADNTKLSVLQGKVVFGSSQQNQQKIRAHLGMEAEVNQTGLLDHKQIFNGNNLQEMKKREEKLLKHYHKNALALSLNPPSKNFLVQIQFKNHGIIPLSILPIRPNSNSYFWTIAGPQGKIQLPSSAKLIESNQETNINIEPGETKSVYYDLSPYLENKNKGQYKISLNYLLNEQSNDSFWTGHLQSNSIILTKE